MQLTLPMQIKISMTFEMSHRVIISKFTVGGYTLIAMMSNILVHNLKRHKWAIAVAICQSSDHPSVNYSL